MTKIKVEVEKVEGECFRSMKEGDYFIVEDHKIKIPDGKYICMWALNTLMPMFPLLLERDHLGEEHWIKDAIPMKCPDGTVSYSFKFID
ncbi:MAG: TIGR04076 family protein [Promethearchaeota archaeon]